MKTMYTGKKIQNLFIIVCCIVSTVTILSVDSYLDAKEKAHEDFFRTGKKVEANYFAYLSNGFTLTQNWWSTTIRRKTIFMMIIIRTSRWKPARRITWSIPRTVPVWKLKAAIRNIWTATTKRCCSRFVEFYSSSFVTASTCCLNKRSSVYALSKFPL